MIRKNKINIESEDWEMAERAIKQSGTVKEKLTSQEIGEETFSGKVEEWVEAVHGVSKIDKKKAVEKMLAELKKRDRKKRAVRVWWTAGGSVAAAILVFFTLTQWLQWGKETSDEEKITTVALTEIKVPTLITMEREHGVLSQEILDLKKAKEIVENLLLKDEDVIQDEEIKVFVSELADSSVVIGLRAWVKTEAYWTTRWRILEEIKMSFDEEGIDIPYNQLTVHMANH